MALISDSFPELIKEWHPTKNKNFTPFNITHGSRTKIWWICPKGHEWEASAYNRARGFQNKGTGCPYCSGKKVGQNNSLADYDIKLCLEWDLEKNVNVRPHQVTPHSGKKVWWKCRYKHSWKTAIYTRTKGAKCPYCSNHKVTRDNSLLIDNPPLAREWHPTKNGKLKPSQVSKSGRNKVWWECNKGHEWQATVLNRNNKICKRGCRQCTGRGSTPKS